MSFEELLEKSSKDKAILGVLVGYIVRKEGQLPKEIIEYGKSMNYHDMDLLQLKKENEI